MSGSLGANQIIQLHDRFVEDLKIKGHIETPEVEAAFRAVPRHLFLPDVPLERVYSDEAILTKLQNGQLVSSSSQPAMMAIMLEQLDLQPGHRVLEVGAGSGYNAGLMAHIVGDSGQVTTIDIDEDLVEGARNGLREAGRDAVTVVCQDGGFGHPDHAPYDRIILTVAAWDIVPAWREQLKPGDGCSYRWKLVEAFRNRSPSIKQATNWRAHRSRIAGSCPSGETSPGPWSTFLWARIRGSLCPLTIQIKWMERLFIAYCQARLNMRPPGYMQLRVRSSLADWLSGSVCTSPAFASYPPRVRWQTAASCQV